MTNEKIKNISNIIRMRILVVSLLLVLLFLFSFFMKVDLFENIYSRTPKGRSQNVNVYFDEIRNGKYNELISKIRVESDKTKRNELKKFLPVVTFGGTFYTRNNEGLKKASGLALLDLDNCKNHNELRDRLTGCNYSYSVFRSPSGNFKVVVKIPIVKDSEEYKARYTSLAKHYKEIVKEDAEIDKTSDLVRLCYLSSDNDIYINDNSETFSEIEIEEIAFTPEIGTITNIPLTDHNEIANRLLIWFKNSHYDPSCRNTSLYKYAISLNTFGVQKSTALNYCLQFEQSGFNSTEIKTIVNSAYKNTGLFGTKFFEDANKKKTLKKFILKGKSNKEIFKEFESENIDKDKLQQEIDVLRNTTDVDIFWTYDDKGKLEVSPHLFKFYLENNQIFKYFPTDSETFTFVKRESNFMEEIYDTNIKDYVLKNLLKENKLDVFDAMAKSPRYFNNEFLSMLDTIDFNTVKDEKDISWLYYKNFALKITKDRIEKIKYDDLDGYVWKSQVIERDYIETDHHDSEYRSFIWYCAGEKTNNYNSLKSVIGYLLHSFKNGANNKSIIFNDEVISDNPNGGSGKSLFCEAIGKIKKTAFIDGKTFDFNKSFPYQTVPINTQLLVFDDVKENFKFENLFSLITQGMTLEYKGQQAIKLNIKDSPKIVITTNYTIKGSGGSFERRKFEIEMSSYFNSEHSPLDEFGRMLFDDWDQEEWARFDKFMINCLQYYLANGLVDFNHKSLELRKIYNETNKQFFEWIEMQGKYKVNERIIKNNFFNQFKNENAPDFDWMKTTHVFTKWLKSYANYKGFDYEENASNGQRWFMFIEKGKSVKFIEEIEEEEDDGFPF